MRDVKPGITGLAQFSLGYTGSIPEGSEFAKLASTLQARGSSRRPRARSRTT